MALRFVGLSAGKVRQAPRSCQGVNPHFPPIHMHIGHMLVAGTTHATFSRATAPLKAAFTIPISILFYFHNNPVVCIASCKVSTSGAQGRAGLHGATAAAAHHWGCAGHPSCAQPSCNWGTHRLRSISSSWFPYQAVWKFLGSVPSIST